jgi:predicted dehydrogenase
MATAKVRWGVLSTAKIGREKVIPGMQRSERCHVAAIASRDIAAAKATAAALGIEKAYGSYEELLADPAIEAIYNPLPNHLHVPWSIRALEAGKHVLCEKPVALTAAEAQQLVEASKRTGRIAAEAFMVRHHPQWLKAREIVREGRIGEARAIQTVFAYFLDDPDNVRNKADIGGGGLYDIGCYAILTARYIFGAEPEKVVGTFDLDPVMKIDRLGSGLAAFPGGRQLSFTIGTQLVPHQRVQIMGTTGRVEVQIPFNTLQGDSFSRVVLGEAQEQWPIEDAVQNMRVIDAFFRSAQSGRWEAP